MNEMKFHAPAPPYCPTSKSILSLLLFKQRFEKERKMSVSLVSIMVFITLKPKGLNFISIHQNIIRRLKKPEHNYDADSLHVYLELESI